MPPRSALPPRSARPAAPSPCRPCAPASARPPRSPPASSWSHLAFLAAECDDRETRRRARRIAEARFPRVKRLEDLDIDAIPGLNPATVAHLAAGTWIDAGEPVVLLGDSGTGKTHLLVGLGTAAAENGRRVRYTTTAQLVNEDPRLAAAVVDRLTYRAHIIQTGTDSYRLRTTRAFRKHQPKQPAKPPPSRPPRHDHQQ